MTKAGPAASLSSDPTAGSAFPSMNGAALLHMARQRMEQLESPDQLEWQD